MLDDEQIERRAVSVVDRVFIAHQAGMTKTNIARKYIMPLMKSKLIKVKPGRVLRTRKA